VYLGLRQNHDIQSAYVQRTADKFNLRVSDDKFTPVLTLNADYARQRASGIISSSTSFSPVVTLLTPTGAQLGFTLNAAAASIVGGAHPSGVGSSLTFLQPLLNSGGLDVNMASVRIGRLDEAINRLALKSTIETTISNIITAYRALVQAEQQLKIAQSAIQRATELVSINQSLIAAGRMAAVDIVQSQADVANQEVSALQAENQRDAAKLQLLTLLALDQRSVVVATDALDAHEMNLDPSNIISTALDNQSGYLQQKCAVEIAAQNLLLAKNNQLWSLNVVGSISQGPNLPLPRTRQPDASAGLQLSIPIGDMTRPQVEVNAQVTLDRSRIQLETAKDQMELSVREAVRQAQLSWRQLTVSSRALELTRRKLEIEREKLRAGRSSNFEAVTYENDLQQSETNELAAKIAYLNALTTIDLQAGTTLSTWRIPLEDAQ